MTKLRSEIFQLTKLRLFLICVFSFIQTSCVFKPDIEAIQAQLTPFKSVKVSSILPATAFTGGGTDIEITGENFNAGVSVNIAGKDCMLKSLVGTTKIVCTAPSAPEGSYDVIVTGVDGKITKGGIEYDGLAFTKISLLIGKLISPTSNNDGYFNNADSRGATQFAIDGNYLYSADYDGNKIKRTDLTTLYSKTIAGIANFGSVDIDVSDSALAELENPTCIYKSANILYFCLSSTAIGKIDLSIPNSPITLVAGRIPADGNVYSGSDALGDKFDNIRQIFVIGTSLYVVDRYTIDKINLTNSTFSIVAGTIGGGAIIDGNGTAASFMNIAMANIINENLYVIDQDSGMAYLRKINLSTGASYAVTTLIGDPLNPITYGNEASDGIGAAASLNEIYGITPYKGNLIIVDQFNDIKIKLIDLTTNTLSTLKVVKGANNKHVLGSLADKAQIRYDRTRGITYINNYGLIFGTEYGLLRIQ